MMITNLSMFVLLPLLLLFVARSSHHMWQVDSSCEGDKSSSWSYECTTKSTTSTTSTTAKTTTTTKAKSTTTVVDGSTDDSSSSSENSSNEGSAILLTIGIRNQVPSDCPGNCWPKACTAKDCNNNGFCFGLRTKPVCLCRRGYCGPLCKNNGCDGNGGCNGHGWCLARSNSTRCICKPEWKGKFCQDKNN